MSEDVTKRLSDPGPAREHSAKGGFDDLIHVVVAAPIDLVDPAWLRSRCGREVLEVYTDGRPVTCPDCRSKRGEHGEE